MKFDPFIIVILYLSTRDLESEAWKQYTNVIYRFVLCRIYGRYLYATTDTSTGQVRFGSGAEINHLGLLYNYYNITVYIMNRYCSFRGSPIKRCTENNNMWMHACSATDAPVIAAASVIIYGRASRIRFRTHRCVQPTLRRTRRTVAITI